MDSKKISVNEAKKILLNLKKERFYWLTEKGKSSSFFSIGSPDKNLFLLDTFSFIIWQAQPSLNKELDFQQAGIELQSKSWLGKKNWRLGQPEEFSGFFKEQSNPLRSGKKNRLFGVCFWLNQHGQVDLDVDNPEEKPLCRTRFLAANDTYKSNQEEFIQDCFYKDWKIISVESYPCIQAMLHAAYKKDKYAPDFTKVNHLLLETTSTLVPLQLLSHRAGSAQPEPASSENLLHLDHFTSPLPELTPDQLTAPNKGLWELWGQSAEELKQQGARARNPAADIQPWPVAIDFGTSSTVVAFQEQGHKKLIRIGVKDFSSPVQQTHFENPTVLELVNLPAALQPWQSTSYRPRLQWGDLRCSHEALASLRDNEGDTGVSASILSKIKHWALRESSDLKVKISDQVNQTEIELAPLTLRNPTKGQALQVSSEDPFDPIEVYAYFLGLAINWRQRGIFLKYYMTFPVAYPQLVKDKILASFRRGLQRSLPEPLVSQPEFDQFSVEERASEPAAFAATALPHFGIQPTAEGEAYAVFDFGGGTTDFDFGLYREPNAEEEDLGYEEVLEHFGASGDKFLGGENLLEHLAYETFKANLDLCREKKIAFTCPLDGQDFPGSELLLDKTRAAFTNTQMLMTRLRPYWEERKQNGQGIEKIKLINRAGEEVNCELQMPYDKLEEFLNQRLIQGVQNFFTALHKAFSEAELSPKKIHVFLAGNASLSPQVQASFGLETKSKDTEASEQQPSSIISDWQRKLFGEQLPEFQVYAPITENPEDPYQATTKTGVALGLLDLCPGSPVAIVNRAAIHSQGEAPFDFYVGTIRRRQFKPALKRHAAYGEWQEAGPVRENTFTLVSSQSPAANIGELAQDDPALKHLRLTLTHADGQKVFVRAMAPNKIELCTASNREALKAGEMSNQKTIEL